MLDSPAGHYTLTMDGTLLQRLASPRRLATAAAVAMSPHVYGIVEPMFRKWIATPNDWTLTILRLAAGIMIFAHGLQKTFGWFGGAGFSAQMAGFERGHIPAVFAFLAIMAEFLGGMGLILGALTRIAAFGVAVNMVVGAYLVNSPNGFFMNWSGRQKGEGFEFHLLVVAMTIVLIVRGGGAASVDRTLAKS